MSKWKEVNLSELNFAPAQVGPCQSASCPHTAMVLCKKYGRKGLSLCGKCYEKQRGEFEPHYWELSWNRPKPLGGL